MMVYKDKSFCMRKACPVTECERHRCHVPKKLPDYMGVAVTDFYGKFVMCPEHPPGAISEEVCADCDGKLVPRGEESPCWNCKKKRGKHERNPKKLR